MCFSNFRVENQSKAGIEIRLSGAGLGHIKNKIAITGVEDDRIEETKENSQKHISDPTNTGFSPRESQLRHLLYT